MKSGLMKIQMAETQSGQAARILCQSIFPESLALWEIQPFFSKPLYQHLPIRAFGKENGFVTRLFTTDTLDFTKTADA
ncbi:MAG: hypothetical protein F6K28_04205 [Microcoleus sp. SIO2G3]|nr:hypothetical protein [Microcoleus sp. SIO2G3]